MTKKFFSFLVLMLFAWGCETKDDIDDPCFQNEPWVAIGTGEQQWVDLIEGDPIVMVHGPQGGWHILGSAKVANMGEKVSIHYTITDVESQVKIADNLYNIRLGMDEDCGGLFPGMYAYLDVSELALGEQNTPPELLAYNELELSMRISNEFEMEVTKTIRVIAQLDPKDVD